MGFRQVNNYQNDQSLREQESYRVNTFSNVYVNDHSSVISALAFLLIVGMLSISVVIWFGNADLNKKKNQKEKTKT